MTEFERQMLLSGGTEELMMAHRTFLIDVQTWLQTAAIIVWWSGQSTHTVCYCIVVLYFCHRQHYEHLSRINEGLTQLNNRRTELLSIIQETVSDMDIQ